MARRWRGWLSLRDTPAGGEGHCPSWPMANSPRDIFRQKKRGGCLGEVWQDVRGARCQGRRVCRISRRAGGSAVGRPSVSVRTWVKKPSVQAVVSSLRNRPTSVRIEEVPR